MLCSAIALRKPGSLWISKPVLQAQLGNLHVCACMRTNPCMRTHWLMLRITNIEKATYWTSGPLGGPGLSPKKDDQLY